MFTKDKKTFAGFTLIELLVVMAIIGVLASVVMVSLNDSRVKSRNAARISQAQQFQKALDMYYFDNNRFPCAQSNDCDYVGSAGQENFNEFWAFSAGRALRDGGYIKRIPADPVFGTGSETGASGCNGTDATSYCYCGGTDQYPASYVLTVELEGADRCAIQYGVNAANLCTSHQSGLTACSAL